MRGLIMTEPAPESAWGPNEDCGGRGGGVGRRGRKGRRAGAKRYTTCMRCVRSVCDCARASRGPRGVGLGRWGQRGWLERLVWLGRTRDRGRKLTLRRVPAERETQKEFAARLRLSSTAALDPTRPAKKVRPPPLPQHLEKKATKSDPKPSRVVRAACQGGARACHPGRSWDARIWGCSAHSGRAPHLRRSRGNVWHRPQPVPKSLMLHVSAPRPRLPAEVKGNAAGDWEGARCTAGRP